MKILVHVFSKFDATGLTEHCTYDPASSRLGYLALVTRIKC